MKKFLIGLALTALFLVCSYLPSMASSGRGSQMTVTKLFTAGLVTADTSGSAVDLQTYEGPVAFIVNTAAAGSGNTIDLKIVESTTSGGSYTDATSGAFTQIGNASSHQVIYLNKDSLKRYVKLYVDITTGSSISASVASSVAGFKKYRP